MELLDQDQQQEKNLSPMLVGVVDDCDIPFSDPPTSGEWIFIKCSPLILFELEQFIEMRLDAYSYYRTKKENYHEAIAYMAEQGYTFTKECQCSQIDMAALVENRDKAEKSLDEFSKKVENLVIYFFKQYLGIYFAFAGIGAKDTHAEKNRCLLVALLQLKDINDYFVRTFRNAFVKAGLKEPDINDCEF